MYVKGILGESYLAYFRKKRMEKAAEFLESTNLKVIEVANSVGMKIRGNLHICLRRHMVFRHWNFEDCLNNGRTYEKSI